MPCFTKVLIYVLALELAILLLGTGDKYLRGSSPTYQNWVPKYWWLTQIENEMNNNNQDFAESLPQLTAILWIPTTIFTTVVILMIVPKKYL
jgi:hypothetical protein